jgi:hypothetical protein
LVANKIQQERYANATCQQLPDPIQYYHIMTGDVGSLKGCVSFSIIHALKAGTPPCPLP